MTASAAALPPDGVIAALRGDAIRWSDLGLTVESLSDLCAAHEIGSLLYSRLRGRPLDGWPAALVERLAQAARGAAVTEAVRRTELAATLDALASASVHPILIKGTPLAYTVYDLPSTRPRCDTDLLLPRAEIERARAALAEHGYSPTVYCDGELLFRQFEMQKIDQLGIDHTLDVHWSVSTQTVFAELLTYDELTTEAVRVPALGHNAWAAGRVHALLLACVHPVMHHRNADRVLWGYDTHLIASRMTADEWRTLARLAIEKQVATIVARALERARRVWRTPVPDQTFVDLSAASSEPSAAYLAERRGWQHEFAANLAHLPSWRSRLRLLREVTFPSASYMSRAYGLGGRVARLVLPALYVHRLASGAGRVLRGRK